MNGSSKNHGFTLVEMLCVVAIVGVLATTLCMSAPRLLKKSNEATALTRLRVIASGIALYQADNDGCFPFSAHNTPGAPTNLWTTVVLPYLPENKQVVRSGKNIPKAYLSPLLGAKRHTTDTADFGVNGAVLIRHDASTAANQKGPSPLRGASISRPSQTALVMTASSESSPPDKGTWYVGSAAYVQDVNYSPRPSDHGSGNVLTAFVDGHTEAIPLEIFQTNRRTLLFPSP